MRGGLSSGRPHGAPQAAAAEMVVDTLRVDLRSMADLHKEIRGQLEARQASPLLVLTVDTDAVNTARKQAAYRRVVNHADLALACGSGLRQAGQILGHDMSGIVSVEAATDCVVDVADRQGATAYLIGGTAGEVQALQRSLAARFPTLRIAGTHVHAGVQSEPQEFQADLMSRRPDLVIASLGRPLEEQLLAKLAHTCRARILLGWGRPASGTATGFSEVLRGWTALMLATVLQRILGGVKPRKTAHVAESGERSMAVRSAVVMAFDDRRDPMWETSRLSPGLMPLGEKCFIQRALESLSDRGCREVDLFVRDHIEACRAVVDDGAQWGMTVRWHTVPSFEDAANRIRLLDGPDAEMVWLACANRVVLTEQLAVPGESEGHVWVTDLPGQEQWTGFACVRWSVLRTWAGGQSLDRSMRHWTGSSDVQIRVVPEHAFFSAETPQRLLDSLQSWFWHHRETGHVTQEIQDGIYLAASSEASAQVAWIPKVVVGEHCTLQAQSFVGPDVILQNTVHVESGARIQRSVVLSGTYIAGELDIRDSIVSPRGVLSVRWNSWIPSSATAGMIGQLHGTVPIIRVGMFERVLAGSLYLFFVPAFVLRALSLRLALRSGRWSHFLDRVGPGLHRVILGRMSLIGVAGREVVPLSVVEAGWSGLLEEYAPGLISPEVALEGLEDSPDASAWADVHWLHHQNWGERWKILCAYALRLAKG